MIGGEIETRPSKRALADFCLGLGHIEVKCPVADCERTLFFEKPTEEQPGYFVAEDWCPDHGKKLYAATSPPATFTGPDGPS